ncbi:hypothetical protein GCM10010307_28510 [Streptomyces vastus]|uniref:Transposase putative helix-turn-helix domain-containing protein n=1 Tax=Streptomyces vastus TaxID=285451 RepID=A0ABP6D292_9ACTN
MAQVTAAAEAGQARYSYRLRVSAAARTALAAEWDRCRWLWNECVAKSKAVHLHNKAPARRPPAARLSSTRCWQKSSWSAAPGGGQPGLPSLAGGEDSKGNSRVGRGVRAGRVRELGSVWFSMSPSALPDR